MTAETRGFSSSTPVSFSMIDAIVTIPESVLPVLKFCPGHRPADEDPEGDGIAEDSLLDERFLDLGIGAPLGDEHLRHAPMVPGGTGHHEEEEDGSRSEDDRGGKAPCSGGHAALLPVPVVEGALQQEDGREAVTDLSSLFAADSGFDQVALRLYGRHPLVPGFDRYPQAFRDFFPEHPRPFRLDPLLAAQGEGKPDQHGAHRVFPYQGSDCPDIPDIPLSPDGRNRLGRDAQGVGDRHPDSVAAEVQPENPFLLSLRHPVIPRKKVYVSRAATVNTIDEHDALR